MRELIIILGLSSTKLNRAPERHAAYLSSVPRGLTNDCFQELRSEAKDSNSATD